MDAPQVTVRMLRPSDAEQVAGLLGEAFAEEFAAAGRDHASVLRGIRQDAWALLPPLRGLLSSLTGGFAVFVAEHDGRVIATATVSGGALPMISGVAVAPGYRRLGIARTLLAEAERFAAGQGRDVVTLDVLSHNTPALRLYEALGYETVHQYLVMETVTATAVLPPGWRSSRAHHREARLLALMAAQALPPAALALIPALGARYLSGPPARLERWLAGVSSYRRALRHRGQVRGFIAGRAVRGQQQARITYPLLPPDGAHALPGALADAVRWLTHAGAASARVDISAERPEQVAVLAAAGWQAGWTFLQMRKTLRRSVPLAGR